MKLTIKVLDTSTAEMGKDTDPMLEETLHLNQYCQ